MAIDHVHDVQVVFRKVLDSMSRPGQIASLQTLADRNDYRVNCFDASLLMMMTLFDAEVTFHVLLDNERHVSQKISEYTLATHTTIDQADFVIALHGTPETVITRAMAQCKQGSLMNPHMSATWMIETAFGIELGSQLTLTGPGVKTATQLHTALTPSIWQARQACVTEYPMGIDLMLTDAHSQVVCIPRTTKVDLMEVE